MFESKKLTMIDHIMRNRRLQLGVVIFLVGYILAILSFNDRNLYARIVENPIKYSAYFLSIIGGCLAYIEMFNIWRKKKEDRFTDVDARRRENESNEGAVRILEEIKELKENQQTIDYEQIEKIINKANTRQMLDRSEAFKTYEKYYESLSFLIEQQAKIADEKASILLDKGTAYSKWGIIFFIFSIISWQILTAKMGFQDQHIYGIVSCSLLFIFIEFLSAWFLKQYRHYVDTSTYLIKIKSIFDRYMLSYLAIKTLPKDSSTNNDYSDLLKILGEDIKWPEDYLLKYSEVSFAKEAMETLTHFARAMKSEAKNAKQSEKTN